MKRKLSAFLVLPLLAALSAAVPATVHADDEDNPQALRKAEMHVLKVSLGGIIALSKGDAKPADVKDYVTRRADAIYGVARGLPTLFPEGSEGGKAKAAIWSDMDGFTAKADALAMAAVDLRKAGESGDMAAIGASIKAIGGACGACHKAYRE
jgi:cytochrome c556